MNKTEEKNTTLQINIHGGNNQILPNVTQNILNIYIDGSKMSTHLLSCIKNMIITKDDLKETMQAYEQEMEIPQELLPLSIYINKVNMPQYLHKLQSCTNASAFAVIVMDMLNNEPRLTPEEVIKERFISLLLPYAPNIVKGKQINNIRQHINDALVRRRKQGMENM